MRAWDYFFKMIKIKVKKNIITETFKDLNWLLRSESRDYAMTDFKLFSLQIKNIQNEVLKQDTKNIVILYELRSKNLTRSNFGLYELCAFNQNDVKKKSNWQWTNEYMFFRAYEQFSNHIHNCECIKYFLFVKWLTRIFNGSGAWRFE